MVEKVLQNNFNKLQNKYFSNVNGIIAKQFAHILGTSPRNTLVL